MTMLSLQSNTVLLPDETLTELDAALKGIDVRRPSSYGDTWGDESLRQDVKSLTPNWAGEALITGSATQALMLTLQQIGRGKIIAIQVPCYFGVLRQARELDMIVKPWDTADELEGLGAVHAVLLTSNFRPPDGLSMAEGHKRRISEFARRHDAWVIEDNAYEPLWFYAPPMPIPVDPARSIRIGSLSKVVSPDFRLGFVRADGAVLEGLRARKITMELSTPRFIQEVARAGVTESALGRWRRELNLRSERMRAALRDTLAVDTVAPDGGPYVCMPLADEADLPGIVARCRQGGLLVDDNRHHYPDGKNRPYLRLHSGGISLDAIPEAIAILASSISKPL